MLREHVSCAEPELQRVSQVDRHGDAGRESGVHGSLYGRLCGQHPRRAGEVHRDRVDVDAGHREAQPLQRILGIEGGLAGSLDQVGDRLRHECAGAAGRVEHILAERVGHQLPHDGAGQPVGRVVLA